MVVNFCLSLCNINYTDINKNILYVRDKNLLTFHCVSGYRRLVTYAAKAKVNLSKIDEQILNEGNFSDVCKY